MAGYTTIINGLKYLKPDPKGYGFKYPRFTKTVDTDNFGVITFTSVKPDESVLESKKNRGKRIINMGDGVYAIVSRSEFDSHSIGEAGNIPERLLRAEFNNLKIKPI